MSKSALQEALEKRERRMYQFDISSHLGFAESVPSGKVRIRVATKLEQDRAVVGAHAYVRELAAKDEKAASDPDILEDAKSAFIAFECCRDAEKDMPAFNSPRDMMRMLTADQIAVLVNYCNEVRAKDSAGPKDISAETLTGLIDLCVEHVGDDIPEAVFAGFSREYLTHMVVMLSCRIHAAVNDAANQPEPEPPLPEAA